MTNFNMSCQNNMNVLFSLEGNISRLFSKLVSKSGVLLFIFFILYSNPEFEYIYIYIYITFIFIFGKLFWIHNFCIKYIIHKFGRCFLLKINNFSHSHISHHLKRLTLCFYNIYKYVTKFVFLENKNAKKLYPFFVFKFNF